MPDNRADLKLELPVRDIGLPVTPLPKDVRQRWSEWSNGGVFGSPPRVSQSLLDVEEKLRLASERRQVRGRPGARRGFPRRHRREHRFPSTHGIDFRQLQYHSQPRSLPGAD